MKVLYIINSLKPYGAEKSIVQIALSFKRVKPIFIILFSVDNDLLLLLKSYGINIYQLHLEKADSVHIAMDKIKPIIQSEKPSILHSMLFQSDMIARKIKRGFPKLILVGSLVNNSYSNQRYENLGFVSRLKLFSTQLRDRITAKYVDYFISNSEAIVRPNMKALGIPRNRIMTIHRGRKLITEPPTILEKDLNKKIENKIVFLNIARLSRDKGQLDLIQAFNEIKLLRNDVILLIAGEGKLREEIEMQIDKYDLKDTVYLLGYRKDIYQLLQKVDYCIFPSYVEGLSGAIIEAILSKSLCIVSNIEENKECFPPNNYGALFFPVGNISALIDSIEKALNLSDLNKNKMIDSSFNYAIKNFDLDNVAKKYEEFYEKILIS